jgi:hypothetical protein
MDEGSRANQCVALSDDDDDDSGDDMLSFNYLAPAPGASTSSQDLTPEQRPGVRREGEHEPSPLVRSDKNSTRGTKRKKANDDDGDDGDEEGGPNRDKGSKARVVSWAKFKKAGRGMDWKPDRDLGTTIDPDADPMLRPQDALTMKNLSYEQLVWARLPFGGRDAYWPARAHIGMESIGTKDKSLLIKNGWNTHQPGQTIVTFLYS